MAIYDIFGNVVTFGGSVSSDEIKKALVGAVADGTVNLGSVVGATLAWNSPGAAWEAYGAAAYQNLLTAYKAIPNSGIPFFVGTDHHGRGVEVHRWLNNHDADTNGMGVMNLNLGDSVTDIFNESELSNVYARSWQVKNHIMVFGNHEIKMTAEVPNLYDLNRWFISTRGRKFYVGPMGCFTVYDDAHAVKYVCVANYILDADGNSTKGLTADAARWLLDELAKNDGYDVVYLQHWPVCTTWKQRTDDAEAADSENHSASYNYKIWQMLLARKNRQSGTFADVYGGEYSYDFSDCKHELLCCLHGHHHVGGHSIADGLTAWFGEWLGNDRMCHFGLIDRLNSQVTIWSFDSTGCLDPLVLPI